MKTFISTLILTLIVGLTVYGQEKYLPSEEDIKWAKQFAGISGPGMLVTGNGYGG
ncbi:MAG: hypothetical protein LIO79_09990 [Rikenellaceae bacterium]|nr:hypothetical protein [Rikenellaceae bacterium]